jgi:hypothetical protein
MAVAKKDSCLAGLLSLAVAFLVRLTDFFLGAAFFAAFFAAALTARALLLTGARFLAALRAVFFFAVFFAVGLVPARLDALAMFND